MKLLNNRLYPVTYGLQDVCEIDSLVRADIQYGRTDEIFHYFKYDMDESVDPFRSKLIRIPGDPHKFLIKRYEYVPIEYTISGNEL